MIRAVRELPLTLRAAFFDNSRAGWLADCSGQPITKEQIADAFAGERLK
jgi:hypothetical protein